MLFVCVLSVIDVGLAPMQQAVDESDLAGGGKYGDGGVFPPGYAPVVSSQCAAAASERRGGVAQGFGRACPFCLQRLFSAPSRRRLAGTEPVSHAQRIPFPWRRFSS